MSEARNLADLGSNDVIETSATGINVTGTVTATTVNATTVDLGDWTITEASGSLLFATQGVTRMKLDSMGNLDVVGNINSSAYIYSAAALIVNGKTPPLAFDFANSYYRNLGVDSTFSNSINHSRASSATMTNSSGTLVTVGSNVPRLGHHIWSGSAWVNEGILHESEARTNLCKHSDNSANWFSNPSGSFTGAPPQSFTLTAAQAVGSDGTLSLTKVAIGSTSITAHELYTSHSSINPSLGMTLSAELKNGNQRYVMLRQYIASNDWFAVTFDLVTGVVTQESVGTGSVSIRSSGVIDLSNGLYRCWLSYIDSVNTSAAFVPTIDAVTSGTPTLASPNGTESYSGTVGTHFYLGKMQLEQGSTASSYIPTSGSTVTRAADILTVSAAKMPWPVYVETTGTELVTNGTFATDISGWTSYNSVISWDAGLLKVNDSANAGFGSQAYQVVTLEVGKVYRLTGSYENSTASRLWIDNSSSNVSPTSPTVKQVLLPATTSSVDFAHTFVATATTTSIALEVDLSGTAYFDNISVKEVDSPALSIQMEGKMTYADNGLTPGGSGAAGEVSFLLWKSSDTDYISTGIDTGGSRSGQYDATQRSATSGGQQLSQGSLTDYSPNTNVPFNLASIHSSTFIKGATEGTLTTSVYPNRQGLPDLSSTNLDLGNVFMGTIGKFVVWNEDIGDTGIASASL